METFSTLLSLVFMVLIACGGWLGRWGRTYLPLRVTVYVLIVLSALAFLGLGSLLMVLPTIPDMIKPVGPMLFGMGLCSLPVMIPFIRKTISKFVFKGLNPDFPDHVWALYIFMVMLLATVVSITAMYNPDAFVEGLKGMPVALMATLNAVTFVAFAFIASGVWRGRSLKATAVELGLTRLSWKQVGMFFGFSLLLAVAIRGLEAILIPLVDKSMLDAIERVVNALDTGGSPLETLQKAIIVGLAAGIGEEVLFRGLVQPLFGVFATALLFTLIHIHYGPSLLLLVLLVVGIILGLIRQRWNTTAAIIVHAGFDFFVILSSLIK